jgi:transcriptional regulator with XRE-family HTH domain
MPYEIISKCLIHESKRTNFNKLLKKGIMKQPELGNKINEIRNQKGITQKELSELCNIDIRTIQRIECGDVTPRMSTLRLLASALSCDINIFNGDTSDVQEPQNYLPPTYLLILFVIGIMYFVSSLLNSPLIPQSIFLLSIFPIKAFIYIITGVVFYFGFYNIGKLYSNLILKISSIIYIVCIPLFLFTIIALTEFSFVKHINQLVIFLLGINSILFGIGLLKVKTQLKNLYRITGILHIILVPFVIIPIAIISIIGWWLIFLSILFQLSIVFMEFRKSQDQQIPSEVI